MKFLQTIPYLFLILFCGIFSEVAAQKMYISDANFEQSLVNQGIDTDGLVNGEMLIADAEAVEHLNVSGAGISDLVNISRFSNLKGLDARNNNLSTIDISQNALLVSLYLDDNSLTSLDLNQNILLRNISVKNNNLTGLDLSQNADLDALNISDNQINVLDLSQNSKLLILVVNNNLLAELDLIQNVNLEDLEIKNNPINSLDLTANEGLRNVDLMDCPITELHLKKQGEYTFVNIHRTLLTDLDVSSNFPIGDSRALNIIFFIVDGNESLKHIDIRNTLIGGFGIKENHEDLWICIENENRAIASWPDVILDNRASFTEYCHPRAVEGYFLADANNDCVADILAEQAIPNAMLRFRKGMQEFYASTDADGFYYVHLDTGTYQVDVYGSLNYWNICTASQTVTVDTNYIVQQLNWSATPQIICPALSVDLGAPFLRMTGSGSNYTVNYCNNGTADAQNVYVEVDIDPDLNVLGTSIPFSGYNASTKTYTFPIGNVNWGDCGLFTIQVQVDTSAFFMQTHCSEARIYPDTLCGNTATQALWNGAILEVESNCLGDSVFFELTNIGADMQTGQGYLIFEDHVMMTQGSVELDAGESVIIPQVATLGKTYRLIANQSPAYPNLLGSPTVTSFVENCNTAAMPNISAGYGTQFSNGNSSPFVAVDCQENIGSYDPNDKQAQPIGYGNEHYIDQNVPLEYRIRFQNTGNDTAFNITVLDTLPSYLDVASIRMGASSHAYNWTVGNGNILQVDFLNIMLPDSTTNEPESNGFFKFWIKQKENLPIGTVLENTAAIYFDYNPPIITNTAEHTIGQNFIVTVNALKNAEQGTVSTRREINVYPNPFLEGATIKVSLNNDVGVVSVDSELHVKVYDMTGRLVKEVQNTGDTISLKRGNLVGGVYLYQLFENNKSIGSGKIIIKE